MSPRHTPDVLLLILILAARVPAQSVLMAESGGKMSWVRAAQGSAPCVERDGKVQAITSRGFILKDAPEYLPVFINVRDPYTRVAYATTNGSTASNKILRYTATIETSYRLDDVFMVVTLGTAPAYSSIVLSEVGRMDPNQEKQVFAELPEGASLGTGTCGMHLFSGGMEVFQGEILAPDREAALDKMVADRIKGVHAAGPRILFGPPPQYPAALKAANLKGQAAIAIKIGKNGAVSEPAVKSATDPAFGAAALAAVQMWRFVPTIKDDHPVDTRAVIPFMFEQPKRS
jgi:TonB family protein